MDTHITSPAWVPKSLTRVYYSTGSQTSRLCRTICDYPIAKIVVSTRVQTYLVICPRNIPGLSWRWHLLSWHMQAPWRLPGSTKRSCLCSTWEFYKCPWALSPPACRFAQASWCRPGGLQLLLCLAFGWRWKHSSHFDAALRNSLMGQHGDGFEWVCKVCKLYHMLYGWNLSYLSKTRRPCLPLPLLYSNL